MVVDLVVNVKDDSYPSFLYWMTAHQRGELSGGKSGKVGVMRLFMKRFTPRTHHLSINTQKIQQPNGSVETKILLEPGPGQHVIRYKSTFLWVNRVIETKSLDFQRGKPWETVTLTTLYAHRAIFEDIFTEAYRLAQQSTEGKTIVYTARTASWETFGEPRTKRALDSVILDRGIKERIISDVRDFLDSKKWYYDRGIPYRRGYLLHGPPGTGKTSFITALAGELDYNIAILNLSERGMTDDRLNYLLTVLPQRTLLLLEDADGAFTSRRTQTDGHGYHGNLTFSGLLNALDGVGSAEERIIFMTTNHLERLDNALIRPGRVDMTMRLGEVTRWQTERLWDKFYGEVDEQGKLRARFIERLEQLGIVEQLDGKKTHSGRNTTAAALQGLFLYNKQDPEGAISVAHALLPQEVMDTVDPLPQSALAQN